VILTVDELVTLTGKRRSDAQRRVLDALSVRYKARPDKSLVVYRSQFEQHSATIVEREPELVL